MVPIVLYHFRWGFVKKRFQGDMLSRRRKTFVVYAAWLAHEGEEYPLHTELAP